MREIKFRAYIKSEAEMVDVETIDWHDKYIISETGFNTDPETGEEDIQFMFDDIELMQYTGLKDKNGKEIYEGDILKIKPNNSIAEVGWDEDGYYGVMIDGRCYAFGAGTDIKVRTSEVIGNIYENPELLGGKR